MNKIIMPNVGKFYLAQVKADRHIRSIISKQLESQKLSLVEWLALGVIAGGTKKGLSMTEISNSLDVTLPQVTVLVTKLLDLKYVKQNILGKDHRGRQVHLTLRGKRTLSKLEVITYNALQSQTTTFSMDAIEGYIHALDKFANIDTTS